MTNQVHPKSSPKPPTIVDGKLLAPEKLGVWHRLYHFGYPSRLDMPGLGDGGPGQITHTELRHGHGSAATDHDLTPEMLGRKEVISW